MDERGKRPHVRVGAFLSKQRGNNISTLNNITIKMQFTPVPNRVLF